MGFSAVCLREKEEGYIVKVSPNVQTLPPQLIHFLTSYVMALLEGAIASRIGVVPRLLSLRLHRLVLALYSSSLSPSERKPQNIDGPGP